MGVASRVVGRPRGRRRCRQPCGAGRPGGRGAGGGIARARRRRRRRPRRPLGAGCRRRAGGGHRCSGRPVGPHAGLLGWRGRHGYGLPRAARPIGRRRPRGRPRVAGRGGDHGFADLTTKQIRRSAHRSTRALEDSIRLYLATYNHDPHPFIWVKTADDILASIERFCLRISEPGH
jgi:hypothetical protein